MAPKLATSELDALSSDESTAYSVENVSDLVAQVDGGGFDRLLPIHGFIGLVGVALKFKEKFS